MKKTLLIALAIIIVPMAVFAADRNVVHEIGTSTDCPYCPGAALAAEDFREEFSERAVILEYHGTFGNDPFKNNEAIARIGFYGITGYPTSVIDGVHEHVGGNASSSIYGSLRPHIVDRMDNYPSPITLDMERTYTPTAYFGGEGVLTTTVINESDDPVTGYFRAAVVESHIPYEWENQDSLYWLVRDMLPDQTGELISLEPGDTMVIDKDFMIDPEWFETTDNALNFELVAFVQAEGSGVETEIYQAAWIPLATPTDADYVSSRLDNADGMLHPGETADYLVTVLNAGDDPWTNLTGYLSSEDKQITIPDDTCAWGACEPGEQVTNTEDVFQIRLRTDGEEGHRPMLLLTIADDYGMEEEIEHQLPEPLAIAEDAVGFELSLPTLLTSSAFATLTLPRAGNVQMSLVDASGRVVTEIYSGKGTAGLNLIRICADDLNAGTYFLKVTAADETRVQKLLVLN